MGRLDELDLSKSLTRKEEARGLDRAWGRLTQLRLTLGPDAANDTETLVSAYLS